MATSNMRARRSLPARMIQNFHLAWLDENIDEKDDDYRNSITKLQQVVNVVNTFTDIDECIDFITDIKEDMTFMMVSEAFGRTIVSAVENIANISSIYIFLKNKTQLQKWDNKLHKVKGVYTDITSICKALQQAAKDYDHNSVTINFIKSTNEISKNNLDTLDCSFMYTQILKEILLTIEFKQEHLNEFLTYCRDEVAENIKELNNIDRIQKEYHDHQPIWWYTYESLLYSMLNRALRVMDVDIIVKMGFFLRDLHHNIDTLHKKQYDGENSSKSFTVYRGQGLSEADFNQLKNMQGGLLAFNNFLSTSHDHAVSYAFAESNQENHDLIGILFEIAIDSSISSTPFANVKDVGHYKEEEGEILFSMHSVFRIGQMKQLNGNMRFWQVNLTLTSDNDRELKELTKSIEKEIYGSEGWSRLGQLLIKMGQFNKAEQLYEILFKQTTAPHRRAHLYHQLGCIKKDQGKYAESVEYHEKSIKIKENISPTHPDLAGSYNNIGEVYRNMGEYSKALEYFEKTLEIFKNTLPTNHHDFAHPYNSIGSVYYDIGKYTEALEYCQKAFRIWEATLPANHPDLAVSCNNIGELYRNMGKYSKALEYFEKTLEIWKKVLPANHSHLAISYNNIGLVYNNMDEYPKALEYFEKAREIRQKTLGANHPDLAVSCNSIGNVYDSMGEYSKALDYYEKALQILKGTLPENHSYWALSYSNIGMVYSNMSEYSKAREYYEKALEIRIKTLPANHPDLASSYNSIGVSYYKIGKYSEATEYYEKAFRIWETTLGANHPDLAVSYNNIGALYNGMGEPSKALEYLEKALEIWKKVLPVNHSKLAVSYNNIGALYCTMSNYQKALTYFERALDIWQHSLPSNHPQIRKVKNTIENVKKDCN